MSGRLSYGFRSIRRTCLSHLTLLNLDPHGWRAESILEIHAAQDKGGVVLMPDYMSDSKLCPPVSPC